MIGERNEAQRLNDLLNITQVSRKDRDSKKSSVSNIFTKDLKEFKNEAAELLTKICSLSASGHQIL